MPEGPHLTRRSFFRWAARGTLAIGASALGGLLYSTWIEPFGVRLTKLDLALPDLTLAFDGLRLVHISDLHFHQDMTTAFYRRCMERINQLNPDLVLITGDFVTGQAETYADLAVSVLKILTPSRQVLAVLGNHDHRSNVDLVREILKAAGILELRNAVHLVENGSDVLPIGGVDDPGWRFSDLDRVLQRLPSGPPAILLAHEPDFADEFSRTGRIAVQLSGHSHGGQVVIPGVGPLYLPVHAQKYPSGLYDVNGMLLYTSRGLGMASLRIRFNCPPEITLFTLRPASQRQAACTISEEELVL